MKIGYSILLGEIIDAENLEYDDCRHLQMVCPECREPVFKGKRDRESDSTHYLSHYDKKISYNADCENRVGNISYESITKENKEARNQRLTLFLSVLKNLLGKSPMYPKGIDKVIRNLERSASFGRFREHFYGNMLDADIEEMIYYLKLDYREQLERAGWAVATTFPIHVQERIAADMFKTLCRPIAKRNLDALFAHSFLKLLQGYGQPGVQYEPGEGYVIDRIVFHMTQIMNQKNKRKADGVIEAMASETIPRGYNKMAGSEVEDDEPSTYFSRIAGQVHSEMYAALVALPYYEVLHSEYADPSKELPYIRGVEPVTEDEKKRVGVKLQ